MPRALSAAAISSAEARIQRLDPYLDQRGTPWLDFIVPIAEIRPAPLIVLHGDPSGQLNAAIPNGPGPGAEALLFWREGDRLLALGQDGSLRSGPVPHELSLEDPDSPARWMWAATATPGVLVTGRDDRQRPVMGVVIPIPATPWYLLAKSDRGEFLAQGLRRAIWIGLAGLLAIFMTAVGLYLLRQRQQLQQRAHLEELVAARTQDLYRMELELARRAELAESATRAKSAFLANMSHKIRTP